MSEYFGNRATTTHGVPNMPRPGSGRRRVPPGSQKKLRGLGDLVAAGLQRLGVEKRAGCGCGGRQAALNRLVPFGKGKR